MLEPRVLIIGSTAFAAHGGRESKLDHDFIASYEDGLNFLKENGCTEIYPANKGKKLIGKNKSNGFMYEHEIAWTNSTSEKLLDLVYETAFGNAGSLGGKIATLDTLYTLKMSHRYRKNSPHFAKTMQDIHVMRAMGAKIPDSLADWFKEREKETYDYGHPSLAQTKANFFAGDGVDYRYDHDSIHLAVKLQDRPAYDYFKPDTSEVYCSKEMFFNCSETIRLNAVYEESCVLALERSIITHPGVLTPESAFRKALEKVSTSITSGWFREYAWENYEAVLQLYESLTKAGKGYVTLFEAGLANGTIKPFK